MELFNMLAKLSRRTRRIIEPYSRMQSRMLAVARLPSVKNITSRALNMRRAPVLANIPRINPPAPPPVISSESVSAISETGTVPEPVPIPTPISYAVKLRAPHVSLVRQISNQPVWLAHFEAIRQAQSRTRMLADGNQSVGLQPVLPPTKQSKRTILPSVLAAPLLASFASSAMNRAALAPPIALPQAPSLTPALSPLSANTAGIGQTGQNARSILPSKLVEIGHQLSLGIPPIPAISKLYSQALNFSKSFARFPSVPRSVPQLPQAQLGLTGRAIKASQIKQVPPTAVVPTIDPHKPTQDFISIGENVLDITHRPRLGLDEVKANLDPELGSADEHAIPNIGNKSHQKLETKYSVFQLSRVVALNLASNGSLRPIATAMAQSPTVGPSKATPAQAREPFSQNREKLVTAFAEMETAQTKLTLTDRNPIPSPPPRVELPRLQSPLLSQNRNTFTVQESHEALRPVDLDKIGPNVFQSPHANSGLADWTAPEPDSLASSNELRLKIAKILEEEARRYLPEE